MIELPVVAEGGLTRALIEGFAPVTDFFAIGPEIWRAEDPLAALGDLTAPLR
jgi:thiamine-phosphate pyrophosphorylase